MPNGMWAEAWCRITEQTKSAPQRATSAWNKFAHVADSEQLHQGVSDAALERRLSVSCRRFSGVTEGAAHV